MKTLSYCAGLLVAVTATAVDWTDSEEVRMRRDKVMSYRATLVGETLINEATHEEGWHTYAMDNLQRAREASGKEKPECELPTRIDITGALSAVGPWRQSPPSDLSNTSIKWYTFGFEGTTYFATKVKRHGDGDAIVRINAQACNASKCSMVDDLELTIPVTDKSDPSEPPIDLAKLVEVEEAPKDE